MSWVEVVGAAWHAVGGFGLTWLAVHFGHTLRSDRVPIIERIARVSDPDLPAELCRYARRLTLVWCGHFGFGAVLCFLAAAGLNAGGVLEHPGLFVLAVTVALFVGERVLRSLLFPGRVFPGLWQQIRDSRSAWYR